MAKKNSSLEKVNNMPFVVGNSKERTLFHVIGVELG